jgi:hypothetical protein
VPSLTFAFAFTLFISPRPVNSDVDRESMAQSFTHYWAGETLGYNEEGRPLGHTAGNDFTKRGVKVGAIAGVLSGQLHSWYYCVVWRNEP